MGASQPTELEDYYHHKILMTSQEEQVHCSQVISGTEQVPMQPSPDGIDCVHKTLKLRGNVPVRVRPIGAQWTFWRCMHGTPEACGWSGADSPPATVPNNDALSGLP